MSMLSIPRLFRAISGYGVLRDERKPVRPIRPRLGVEALELRDVPCATCDDGHAAHGDNASLAAEHKAILALVPCAAVTHTAAKSGNWSDPATWGGSIPTDGSNVLIPCDVVVRVDAELAPAVRTIRLEGTLTFATDRNTALTVDTIVVTSEGILRIGTKDRPLPANRNATIRFDDSGPIDRVWDPRALSRGLISHGTVEVYGERVTPFVKAPTGGLLAGTTTINLGRVPTGWSAGDTLLIPSTNPRAEQDELVNIVSVSKSGIVIDRALQWNHTAPANLPVYIANMTRNVVLESENSVDIDRRGHIMFMHSNRVDFEGAELRELGRTNKDVPVNDAKLDANGQLVAGTGTNSRARYALHFHRTGIQKGGATAIAKGNVVWGSPGWGFVNHSSRAAIVGNIAYNTLGAGFVTEAGDEVGSFVGNLAVKQTGSGDGLESREKIDDWGHGGHGFWFQGPGTRVVNNVAAGSPGGGYFYFTKAIHQGALGRTLFPTYNLPNPSIAPPGAATIEVGSVPIPEFRGNQAFAMKANGLEIWTHLRHTTEAARSVITDFSVWNSEGGVAYPYSENITMRGGSVLGTMVGNAGRFGVESNHLSSDFRFEGVRVEGWSVGIDAPMRGKNSVVGGWFNNARNIFVENAVAPGRVIRVAAIQRGNLLSPVSSTPAMIDLLFTFDPNDPQSMYRDQGIITYNGQRVFDVQQCESHVPFPVGSTTTAPASLIGKTNAQIEAEFGLRLGGYVGRDQSVFQGIGAYGANYDRRTAVEPRPTLVSAKTTTDLANYRLSYQLPNGQRVDEVDPTTLVVGWNILTRTINGQQHGFVVVGQ